MIEVVLQFDPGYVCTVFELRDMPDRVAAGCRHCKVGCVGCRVGGSSVVHDTAERKKRPMATAIRQDYIDLPAGNIVSSAAIRTPSAMDFFYVFNVGVVCEKGDLLPSNVEVVWVRSPRKVGATLLPNGARTSDGNIHST